MSLAATLMTDEIDVEPGEEAVYELLVRNTGSVVDRLNLEVLGDASPWTTVEPPSLSLFPGDEATAQVILRPPRSPDVRAGSIPIAVRVTSSEAPDATVVEEGTAVVREFTEMGVDLLPKTSRGRRKGRHEIAIDNTGNHPVPATVYVTDPDDLIKVAIKPESLVTQPGTASFVRIKVKPKKRFLRGPNKTIPFQVAVVTEADEPDTADGVMVQEQLIPAGALTALALLIAGVIAAFVLWTTVLSPVVKSAARSAAEQQTQGIAEDVEVAKGAAVVAQEEASTAKKIANGEIPKTAPAGGTGSSTPTTQEGGNGTAPNGAASASGGAAVPSGSGAGMGGAPVPGPAVNFATRLGIVAPPLPEGQYRVTTYKIPAKKIVLITDVFLQNPRGDVGFIQIRRGNAVLHETNLSNFRDLDIHMVTPWQFGPEGPIVIAVSCQNPGTTRCTPGASFSGTMNG